MMILADSTNNMDIVHLDVKIKCKDKDLVKPPQSRFRDTNFIKNNIFDFPLISNFAGKKVFPNFKNL